MPKIYVKLLGNSKRIFAHQEIPNNKLQPGIHRHKFMKWMRHENQHMQMVRSAEILAVKESAAAKESVAGLVRSHWKSDKLDYIKANFWSSNCPINKIENQTQTK